MKPKSIGGEVWWRRWRLRYFLGIHIFLDCRIWRGAQRVEDEQDLVAFNQLARLLDCFRWTVAVVIADEIDLAAVDAAFGIDLPGIEK